MSENHPIASLKAMLRSVLLADAAIHTALSGAVHDAPPRGLEPPYLILGDASARDNATNDADGRIIDIELVVVTRERGTRNALHIAALIEARLASAGLIPDGLHLVTLIHRETLTRQDVVKSLTRAAIRLRAFIEPL